MSYCHCGHDDLAFAWYHFYHVPSEEAGHSWWQAHCSLVLVAFGASVDSLSSREYVQVDVMEVRSRVAYS